MQFRQGIYRKCSLSLSLTVLMWKIHKFHSVTNYLRLFVFPIPLGPPNVFTFLPFDYCSCSRCGAFAMHSVIARETTIRWVLCLVTILIASHCSTRTRVQSLKKCILLSTFMCVALVLCVCLSGHTRYENLRHYDRRAPPFLRARDRCYYSHACRSFCALPLLTATRLSHWGVDTHADK